MDNINIYMNIFLYYVDIIFYYMDFENIYNGYLSLLVLEFLIFSPLFFISQLKALFLITSF